MSTDTRPLLKVTVFSDYICPFCYLGWLRLEKLRRDYDLRVNWCMTEIHPENPAAGCSPTAIGYPPEQWGRMVTELDVLAAEEGVRFADLTYTTNSRRALLLAEAAKEEGPEVFYALHRRLFEAYLCEGRNLADEQVLRELVRALELDPSLPDRAWSEARYARRLEEYTLAAREFGIRVTPTFFFGAVPLSGLQTVATLWRAAAAALGEKTE
jgi:predicted DsbA family dithiol-disulfide isomerase